MAAHDAVEPVVGAHDKVEIVVADYDQVEAVVTAHDAVGVKAVVAAYDIEVKVVLAAVTP